MSLHDFQGQKLALNASSWKTQREDAVLFSGPLVSCVVGKEMLKMLNGEEGAGTDIN